MYLLYNKSLNYFIIGKTNKNKKMLKPLFVILFIFFSNLPEILPLDDIVIQTNSSFTIFQIFPLIGGKKFVIDLNSTYVFDINITKAENIFLFNSPEKISNIYDELDTVSFLQFTRYDYNNVSLFKNEDGIILTTIKKIFMYIHQKENIYFIKILLILLTRHQDLY